MESYYSGIITILIIIVVLFFVLREVNCWYWKINERIKLQNEIITLLKQIVYNKQPDENTIQELPNQKNQKISLTSLSNEEKKIVSNLQNIGLKEDELIIINKTTRQILKVIKDQWLLKYNKYNLWEIIIENE